MFAFSRVRSQRCWERRSLSTWPAKAISWYHLYTVLSVAVNHYLCTNVLQYPLISFNNLIYNTCISPSIAFNTSFSALVGPGASQHGLEAFGVGAWGNRTRHREAVARRLAQMAPQAQRGYRGADACRESQQHFTMFYDIFPTFWWFPC